MSSPLLFETRIKMAASRTIFSAQQVVRRFGVIRQFSVSSPTCDKLIKPAIQVYGIGGKYAHAIYSAASRKNSLDAVEKELNKVKELMKTDTRFTEYVMDPTINKKEKQAVLGKTLKDNKYSELTVNLFGALAENSRLPKINEVIGAFDRLMKSHRGEVHCTVTSAKPLDANTKKELDAALRGFLKKGETLQVDTQIDNSLIGGVVLDIGGEYHVDMSIASKIKKISSSIRDGI